MTEPLWDSHQLADFLGVPRATLEQWRYLGKGPAFIRVGRHVRYRRAAVEAWLDSQTQPTDQ